MFGAGPNDIAFCSYHGYEKPEALFPEAIFNRQYISPLYVVQRTALSDAPEGHTINLYVNRCCFVLGGPIEGYTHEALDPRNP